MKYVALLRGINVGGNKKVDMKELKKVFESLGFKNVSSYINSGNMIFDAQSPSEKGIEETLEKHFGFFIPTLLRSRDDIVRVKNIIPSEWVNDGEMKTDVLFLWESVDTAGVMNEIRQNPEVDHCIYTPGAIIWHILKSDYKRSKMHDFIGTRVYKNMTARNVNTVRKIAELMQ